MTRALSSTCRLLALAFLLMGLAGGRAFAGKPTVAVLGLEVVDPTGQIDQASTQAAKDLTDALRARAKLPTGPYAFAPGSEKELIDEKLIKNCDNEALSCMSQIGKDLGADFLIYGRLEKKPDGYAITVNLLNVNKKKFEKAKSPLVIPHAAAKDPTAVGNSATKAYNDLVGVVSNGTLVVRSNADHGTVLLDNEPKGTLASGTLTLSLPEGPYRLIVDADGYERSSETKITIRSGETTTQSMTLTQSAGPAVPNKNPEMFHETKGTVSQTHTNIWKPLFVGSVILGVGAGSFWGVSYFKEQSAAKDAKDELMRDMSTTDGDCSNSSYKSKSSAFSNACKYKNWTTYGIVGTGVSVLLIGITGYLAFGRSSESATQTHANTTTGTGTVGRRVRKPPVMITPVVQANGGGFRIDW